MALALRAGDKVTFVELAPGRFQLLAINLPASELKGMLRSPPRPVAVEEMTATPNGQH